ncbi:MAG: ABC transporter permease [Bacteroidales bacterium]
MFKSSVNIALRFLWRNKSYSILNYLCLTFGLTCSIIAALHINRIIGFDKFHSNYERLYSIEANVTYFNGDRFPKQNLSASLPDILNKNIPEFELIARIANGSYTFFSGDKSFTESGIYTDESFPDMFSFPLVSGDVSKAILGTNSIVISERMALKYFESTDCTGKSLIVENDKKRESFVITGVLKDVPSQSSIRFDFIVPFSKYLADYPLALETGASSCQIWALLNKNAESGAVGVKIRDLIKSQETTLNQELFLFPLKEKALYSYAGGRRNWNEMRYIVLAGSLGFAILLIACFNYINLAIAMNIKRYHEAGIKKVVGAKKSNIVFQYLIEAFILTIISLLTAIDLARIVIRGVNTMVGSDIQFSFTDFPIILVFTAIAFFTGIVSGLLPALYLSSSNPVITLKGKIVTSHSFSLFRQSLIVFQFTIPVILIVIMMIIRTQDKYMRNFDIGFDKDRLIILDNSKNLEEHEESIKADLLSIPGIESVSFSNCIPTRGAAVSNEVLWDGREATEKLHFWYINTDFNYKNAVNLKISDGRYFDRSFPADSGCYLINDVAAKVMKYDDPVGKSLTLEGRKGTIIGVFNDFHALDLSGPFTPTIISLAPENRNNLLISFSSGSYSSISEKISNVFARYEPDAIYQPRLFSDLLKRSELVSSSNLIGVAFFIALLLACLGLSGLASFTAESRTKEIGIRKTNGATTLSIMNLLGKNYSKWLIIAMTIAIPIANLVGNMFLSRFHFRTPMPLWTFIAGPVLAYIIALGTVSWQSWRAATRNPVEALRYE